MNYLNKFIVSPGSQVKLEDYDPQYFDKHEDKKSALKKMDKLLKRMDELQYKLYAEHKQSVLIILQAPDTGGKDGVVRHVISSMNPQSCRVVSFKEPSALELEHDFLWRIKNQAPNYGEVVVFNRSHYEDVLIVRIHNIVPKKIWMKRYDLINDFEQELIANNTHILKFYLNISKEEQLQRFKKRLDDPARQWKISEADYSERKYWDVYKMAYEEVFSKCNSELAPWYIIPSDHKWFRDLAIATIIVEEMEKLIIQMPEPTVDIEEIRSKYHEEEVEMNKKVKNH